VVGAGCRRRFKFARDRRCVTCIQGGCQWSEHSRGLNFNLPESGDVFQLDKEGIGGMSRVQVYI
jgi:hypothetical protein